MDRGLADRLTNLGKQCEVLREARNAYLLKEAERKHFEAGLIVLAEGKSQAEKTTNAQANPEWAAFQRELAKLEGEFEFERLKYEILDKAWISEHATYKIEERTMKRGGAA